MKGAVDDEGGDHVKHRRHRKESHRKKEKDNKEKKASLIYLDFIVDE